MCIYRERERERVRDTYILQELVGGKERVDPFLNIVCFVYICIYIYIYIHIHTYIHTHIYLSLSLSINIYVYIYIYIYMSGGWSFGSICSLMAK